MTEEVFDCVQCGARYLELENQVLGGACSFHSEHNWERYPKCCGSYNPCKKGAHRPKHHCDYRYGNFFAMFAAINNYTDTHEVWGEATDKDMNSGKEQLAKISQLLRWKSRANRVPEDLLIVQVGRVYDEKYYFAILNAKDLDDIGKSGKVEISRNSESNSSYSMAKWIITDNIISGIHLEAKEATSSQPHIVQVNFSPFPLKQNGESITLSEAGMPSFNPESKYVLPAEKKTGALAPLNPVRAPRTNFPTQGQLNLRVKVSEVKANENRKLNKGDIFTGSLNLININKGKDAEPIVIVDVTCEWRYTGEKEWKPVDTLDIEKNFSLYPMTNAELPYTINLMDNTKCVNWFGRAWVGRNQPIRFKFTLEDVEGLKGSQIVEYVFKPPTQYEKEKDDALFLFVDDLVQYDRGILRGKITFRTDYPDGEVFSVDGSSYKEDDLKALVFKAKEENNYEQKLIDKTSEGVTKKAWGLIDGNTNRVYAVKALITNSNSAHMGYFELPLYGKPVTITKPNSPATESVEFPHIEPHKQGKEYLQDDDFDDKLIPVDKPSASQSSGGSSSGVMSLDANSLETLNKLNENMKKMADTLERFESVDRSITRLADSFEKIVVILSKK